ncbi:hypothetical protein [Dankookia sp. P2]|uniref:hypothetical protein n=1 Tax=Dankookia sp. P2 TaxID=3423955 RepID=UPI003D676CC2
MRSAAFSPARNVGGQGGRQGPIDFAAADGLNGRELWTTGGTARGTDLLAELWPGGGPGNPTSPVRLGAGHVLVAGTEPQPGSEPWITDGTAAGTHRILDINAAESGFSGSSPSNSTPLGDGRALFVASDPIHGSGAWVTDATADGTHLLGNIFPGATGSGAQGFLLL